MSLSGRAAGPPAADEEAQALVAATDAHECDHGTRCGCHPSRLAGCGTEVWYGYVILCLCTLARLLKSYGQVRHWRPSERFPAARLRRGACAQNNTLFVSVPGILADTGMSRTALGSWFSAACLVAAAAQPGFGRLHDRFGGRACIPAALLALALALLGLSASTGATGVFLSLIVSARCSAAVVVPRALSRTRA